MASYQPESTQSVSLTRPMSVLEEEITGDIYTCDSDGDELSEQLSKTDDKTFDKRSQILSEKSNRNEIKMLNLESRLPGQVRAIYRKLNLKLDLKLHKISIIFSNVNVQIDWCTNMKYRAICVVMLIVHNMDQWFQSLVQLVYYWHFIVQHICEAIMKLLS